MAADPASFLKDGTLPYGSAREILGLFWKTDDDDDTEETGGVSKKRSWREEKENRDLKARRILRTGGVEDAADVRADGRALIEHGLTTIRDGDFARTLALREARLRWAKHDAETCPDPEFLRREREARAIGQRVFSQRPPQTADVGALCALEARWRHIASGELALEDVAALREAAAGTEVPPADVMPVTENGDEPLGGGEVPPLDVLSSAVDGDQHARLVDILGGGQGDDALLIRPHHSSDHGPFFRFQATDEEVAAFLAERLAVSDSSARPEFDHRIAPELQIVPEALVRQNAEAALAGLFRDDVVPWEHVVLAGGAAVQCALGNPIPDGADLDLFLRLPLLGPEDHARLANDAAAREALEREQVGKAVRAILGALAKPDEVRAVMFRNSLTLLRGYPDRIVQIVTRPARSIEAILRCFDLDCCCAAWDGERLLVLPRFLRALRLRHNIIDVVRTPGTQLFSRAAKYCRRGFGAVLTEHCVHAEPCEERAAAVAALLMLQLERPRRSANMDMAFDLHHPPPLPFSPSDYGRDGSGLRRCDEYDVDDLPPEVGCLYGSPGFPYGPEHTLESLCAELGEATDFSPESKERKPYIWTIPEALEGLLPEDSARSSWQASDALKMGIWTRCYECGERVPFCPARLCKSCDARYTNVRESITRNIRARATQKTTGPHAMVMGARRREFALCVDYAVAFLQESVRRYRAGEPPEATCLHVIVTGARRDSSGVGNAVASFLESVRLDENNGGDGGAPAVRVLRTTTDAAAAAAAGAGDDGWLVFWDAEDPASDEGLERAARDRLDGRIDLLINNAARTTCWDARGLEVPFDELARVLQINCAGPVRLIQRLLPFLQGGGRVVNVGSPEGRFSQKAKSERHPHTNASKAALHQWTMTAAPTLLREHGVRLHLVDPGWMSHPDGRTRSRAVFPAPLLPWMSAVRVLDPALGDNRDDPHLVGVLRGFQKELAW